MRIVGRHCIAVLLFLDFAGHASAWWDMGHMEIAAKAGNDEKVLVPGEAEPIALHLFWDRLPGAAGTPADAIAAAKVFPETHRAAASVDDPALWLIESFTIAQNDVYRPAILDGEGPFALDQAYVDHAEQVANRRVALASTRLAALLSETMK
ncbi:MULTISPECIES: S1/P1 nuclease [unclassified Sinorhizobium]|uniref:S1/P1 nuclease n=1 Tax=unclassified Sinorhizobium TaxID=2613772 RepID=UPI003525EBD9